ncbi:hypothetical protein [Cryptosporangium sp. NPDC051539]|uniref:hypothetical protein n=1 Tax=Cryptosporangium sp. NPDC051539 TaxID=3363962 RepID=UPI0037A148A0
MAIHPACTILCAVGDQRVVGWNGRVFVSDAISPDNGSHFTPCRPMSGPRGNPGIGFSASGIPDTYDVSEVWQHIPGSPVVFRGQATPATRHADPGPDDTLGSAWFIHTQDAMGVWSGPVGSGTAHNGGVELDTPETAAFYVPHLMTVGDANPQVFACAGGRTQDTRARTTWLLEAAAPNAARGTAGSATRIQDLLYGDRYFRPPPPSPLGGPPPRNPPAPPVAGAGDSTPWGDITHCAMRQIGDDLTTRQLHLIVVSNGHLFHSVASDWGTAHDGNGVAFSRFRAVSPWVDVEQATGVRFGPVSSAALVAQPNGVSIFFTAAAGGKYRIWRLVQMLPSGTWRPPQDVLALSGDAPDGTVYGFQVAAGRCPRYGAAAWDESDLETVLALWGGPTQNQVLVIRVGTDGRFSRWQSVPPGQMSGEFYLRQVSVTTRPFGDDGAAFP